MTKEEWIQQVGRGFARSMPDQFPGGYAYWLAEQRANEGAYDAYIRGDYPGDVLYVPTEGLVG